ncbi:MAG: hypothetical protein OXC71_03555 [Chloroflexi bacterium]|nr:hypothetical protein [Chloroflexota bacterium]
MRVVLVWIGRALALAAVACEDEPKPPALVSPSPTADETQAPMSAATLIATATTEPTPTAAPTSKPSATPDQTAAPSPEPSATSTATAASPLRPYAIEVTPITRGEPRPLPAGLALYYSVWPCTGCDAEPTDYRRVVFDEAVGTFREDRPLAFFDGLNENDHYYLVRDFGVSESGQTLAATVCHAGFCEIEPVGGGWFPGPDAELRLWVTRNGGLAWEDWGQLLPQTRIVEVIDDDVLLVTRNIWQTRPSWAGLTDEFWEATLVRLAPLGLDELAGHEELFRWSASGEAYPQPPEPTPPTVGRVDWRHIGERPDGASVWTARYEHDHVLAIADRQGTPLGVYGATTWLGGSFVTDDLLISLGKLFGTPAQIQASMELIDLATATIHEVDGLPLPFGPDPNDSEPRGEFYRFITARPALAPATARATIEFVPLTLGEPRELPNGVELYFADWPYEGFATGVARVIRSADGFTTERPWAIWDDSSAYVTSFQVSDDGRTMAAAVCEQGFCLDCYFDPTEDASLRLRVSRDGGVDWEDWGELPQGAYIEAVTADDVAVTAWEPTRRLWWFRSGEDVRPPAGFLASGVEDWYWRSGSGFVWDYGGNARVTDSASVLLPPSPAESPKKSTGWYLQQVPRDGWSLWLRYEQDAEHFALMGDGGDVADTFSWSDELTALGIVGFLSDDILIGQLSLRLWDRTETPTTVLVDLSNHTVHPAEGLVDLELGHCDCLWFVRPGAEEPVVVEDAGRGGPL